jgi:hypothetical protein
LIVSGKVGLWSLTDDEDIDAFGSAQCTIVELRASCTDPLPTRHRPRATAGGDRRLTGMTRLVQGQVDKAFSISSKP